MNVVTVDADSVTTTPLNITTFVPMHITQLQQLIDAVCAGVLRGQKIKQKHMATPVTIH